MQGSRLKIIASVVIVIVAAWLCGPSPSEGAAVVRTEKRLYNPGEPINVYFSHSPGIDSDWICIAPAGAPDTEAGDFQYMPRGAATGIIGFAPQPPGNYEVRAYYHYRQRGYVVTGRYPFSVSSVPVIVGEPLPGEVAPPEEQVVIDPGPPPEEPPAIEYTTEPDLVVLPGTDVYAAPGIQVDIFFQQGWWWRPWGGYWYRSRYYDRGWAYYPGRPGWYVKIPSDWRHNYRNHIWGGHTWNPRIVPHRGIDRHWRDGRWRYDHGWAGQGRPAVRRDRPGDRRPGVRTDRPGDHKPGTGAARPAVKREATPAARPGSPARPAVKGGGTPGTRPESPGRPAVKGSGPGDGAARPAVKGGGARPARPVDTDKPAVRGGGARGGQPEAGGSSASDDRERGRQGDGPGRGGEGGRRR